MVTLTQAEANLKLAEIAHKAAIDTLLDAEIAASNARVEYARAKSEFEYRLAELVAACQEFRES